MYDKIADMYESGELDRIFRYCGVRPEDWEDLKQEVALILLTTPPGRIAKLGEYTISVVRKQYHSRKSRWWKEEGRWKAHRRSLPAAGRDVPEEE